ncbi:MAG TPA: Trm112 family protein [Desulfotignum sp.]|nr:Trm112 family protein [Desulfotignum sp.]
MGISKDLLEILVCPKCKGPLRMTKTQDGLVCDPCLLLYEIKDDIPIMLVEEAKPVTP